MTHQQKRAPLKQESTRRPLPCRRRTRQTPSPGPRPLWAASSTAAKTAAKGAQASERAEDEEDEEDEEGARHMSTMPSNVLPMARNAACTMPRNTASIATNHAPYATQCACPCVRLCALKGNGTCVGTTRACVYTWAHTYAQERPAHRRTRTRATDLLDLGVPPIRLPLDLHTASIVYPLCRRA
jgi:hypothetical protein